VLVSETGRANYTCKPIRRVHLSKFSSKIIMGEKKGGPKICCLVGRPRA